MGKKNQSDGLTDVRQPYKDQDIRRLGYKHDAFEPEINGDDAGAATRTLSKDVLVRAPINVRHFSRALSDSAWRKIEGQMDGLMEARGAADFRGACGAGLSCARHRCAHPRPRLGVRGVLRACAVREPGELRAHGCGVPAPRDPARAARALGDACPQRAVGQGGVREGCRAAS